MKKDKFYSKSFEKSSLKNQSPEKVHASQALK